MEKPQDLSFNISCEIPLTTDDTDDDESMDRERFKPVTLPRKNKPMGDESSSRIPRSQHFKSTFVPIQNTRNGHVKPRVKRKGTPLQELDRKWALQECEELTTWTNELLNSQGQQLNKDLRKAISDGFTLPRVIEIVFNRTINTLRTDVELSKEERLEILSDCLEYLNSIDCSLAEISPQELESGDLKAVLTVLAAIRDAMGQGKSKTPRRSADKTKLIAQDKGYSREVGAGAPGAHPVNHDIITVVGRQVESDLAPRKMLTTFQAPISDVVRESSQRQSGIRPLKSIMKGSQSLDNLDSHGTTTIVLGRSKSHDRQRLSPKSSSSISINVDSGEQEYEEEMQASSSHQLKSSSVNAQWTSSGSNNDFDTNNKSAFTYLSSRGRSRHERYEQEHTRLSYQALIVRDQPSGDSNPSTPALRDSTPRELTPTLRNAASKELALAVNDATSTPREATTSSPNSPRHKTASKASKKSQAKNSTKGKSGQQERKSQRGRSKSQTGQKENSALEKKNKEQRRRRSSSSETCERPARERTPNRHKNSTGRRNSKARKVERNSPLLPPETDQPYPEPTALLSSTNKISGRTKPVDNSEAHNNSPQPHQQVMKSRAEANSFDSPSPESLSRSDTFTVRSSPSDRVVSQGEPCTARTVTPLTRRETLATESEQAYSEIAAEVNATEGIVYYDPVPVSVQPVLQLPHSAEVPELQTFKPVQQPMERSVEKPVEKPMKKPTPPFEDFTEAQLRRLSMPTTFDYREGSRTHTSTARANDEYMVPEQTTLDNIGMEDSFYDNIPRPSTPTLPALTDNTDIESVSDVLHNKRYKRSASVSDRMLFTAEETSRTVNETVQRHQTTARDGCETEDSEQITENGRETSRAVHHRSSRHRKPPRPKKADIKTEKSKEGPSLEEKVAHLEEIFDKLNNWISVSGGNGGSKRSSLAESASSQRSGAASKYSRKYKHGHIPDCRVNKRRFERIESHIMTLAKSVTHISSEMKSHGAMHAEIERLSAEVALMKKGMDLKNSSSHKGRTMVDSDSTLLHKDQSKSTVIESKHRARKLNKLTQFFGSEPPMMKFFLKELGYEKYTSKFEKSQIGVLELPYVSEEQLKSIGIPLGPRMRILQEAKDIQREITHVQQQTTANGHSGKTGKKRHTENSNDIYISSPYS